MIAVEYYWTKAQEALEKADRQTPLSACFVSIAMVYRALADSELQVHQKFPGIAPRFLGQDIDQPVPEPATEDS